MGAISGSGLNVYFTVCVCVYLCVTCTFVCECLYCDYVSKCVFKQQSCSIFSKDVLNNIIVGVVVDVQIYATQ